MTNEKLDELEALIEDAADLGFMDGNDMERWIRSVRGALPELVAMGRKVAELGQRVLELEAREIAVHDRAYAYGFRAGWNEGVQYEQCQEVKFERKASGDPESHLRTLASMDDRIASARAALQTKGTPT
jgi:hypothetical protein